MADNCLPEDVNGGKIVLKGLDLSMDVSFLHRRSPSWNNNRTTDGPKSAEELVDLMKKLKAGLDFRSPLANRDAIVMVEGMFEELRRQLPEAKAELTGFGTSVGSFLGIPVYDCPTDAECIALAKELVAKGLKVAIVLSPGVGYPEDPPMDLTKLMPLANDPGDQAPNFEHHVFGYADNSAFRKAFPPGPPQAD